MSKTVKIVIAIVVILVVLVILYYVFSGGSSAAVKKAKSGNYGTWGDGKSPDWGAFIAKSISLFGQTPDIGVEGGKPQAQASGYLRGMNVARTAANLAEFETEIKAYIASGGKTDWEQTTGALVK